MGTNFPASLDSVTNPSVQPGQTGFNAVDAILALESASAVRPAASIVSSATPTLNTNVNSALSITALATGITSMTTNLTGTPNNFDKLLIRIKDNGTAQTIAWGASFEPVGVALPTTTVISKRLTVGFIYDSVAAKWGCVATAQEA